MRKKPRWYQVWYHVEPAVLFGLVVLIAGVLLIIRGYQQP